MTPFEKKFGRNVDGLLKSIENILHLLAITVGGVTAYLFFVVAMISGILEIYIEKHTLTQLERRANVHETKLVR